MKPDSRAVPIVLGLLVFCGVLFGTPPPSSALITGMSIGDTVTFQFDNAVLPVSGNPNPYPYLSIYYGFEMSPTSGATVYSTVSWFDDLGSAAVATSSGSATGGFTVAFSHSYPDLLGLFDDPTSYMTVTLNGIDGPTTLPGASFNFNVTGGLTPASLGAVATVSIVTAPVPEPSTLLLLASGLAGLGGVAWRRNRK